MKKLSTTIKDLLVSLAINNKDQGTIKIRIMHLYENDILSPDEVTDLFELYDLKGA